jgi:ACR3 family arsenite efflux pump ArsB
MNNEFWILTIDLKIIFKSIELIVDTFIHLNIYFFLTFSLSYFLHSMISEVQK